MYPVTVYYIGFKNTKIWYVSLVTANRMKCHALPAEKQQDAIRKAFSRCPCKAIGQFLGQKACSYVKAIIAAILECCAAKQTITLQRKSPFVELKDIGHVVFYAWTITTLKACQNDWRNDNLGKNSIFFKSTNAISL